MSHSQNDGSKKRNFIIGSLHRFGDSAALEAPNPRKKTLEQLLASGEQVVSQHRQQSLYDLSKLSMELRQRMGEWTHTPIVRAVTLMRALEQLPSHDRALLALTIVYDWSNLELTQVALLGLKALRQACARAEPSRAEKAMERLDTLMAFLPCLTVDKLGAGIQWVSMVGPDESRRAFRDFQLRHKHSRLRPETQMVVLLPPEESATPRVALVEYLQRCFPEVRHLSSKHLLLASAQDYEGTHLFDWLKNALNKSKAPDRSLSFQRDSQLV